MNRIAICLALLPVAAGCALQVPELPSEDAMPVQDILAHAVCELQRSFSALEHTKNFDARGWAISISLSPKVDVQTTVGLTGSRRSTIDPKIVNYTNFLLASPGLQADFRSHRDGSVSYVVHSRQLLDDRTLRCDAESTDNALMQRLGIEEWLQRLVAADETGISALTRMDKPTYNSQVIAKFNAGPAGPSFIGPYGSVAPTVLGARTRDITLGIAMAPDPQKVRVRTLPEGTINKGFGGGAQPVISSAARLRLDQIQTESVLRNLRLQPE